MKVQNFRSKLTNLSSIGDTLAVKWDSIKINLERERHFENECFVIPIAAQRLELQKNFQCAGKWRRREKRQYRAALFISRKAFYYFSSEIQKEHFRGIVSCTDHQQCVEILLQLISGNKWNWKNEEGPKERAKLRYKTDLIDWLNDRKKECTLMI